jgi:hypothetical protein
MFMGLVSHVSLKKGEREEAEIPTDRETCAYVF